MKPPSNHSRSLGALLVGLGLLTLHGLGNSSLNTILALVDDDPITIEDIAFDRQDWTEEADCRAKYQEPDLTTHLKEVRLKTLNRLIEVRLIVQEFDREGLYFSDTQIDDRADNVVQKEYGGSEDQFHADLAKRGETLEEYRTFLREQCIVQYMTTENVDKKAPSTDPAPHELLRQAWIKSLRDKAYLWTSNSPP
jgi:hypothetical protein